MKTTREVWHARPEDGVHPAHAGYTIYDENGLTVARAAGEDDARLIAAAPDLLKAACDIVREVATAGQIDATQGMQDAWHALNAAIDAAATGVST